MSSLPPPGIFQLPRELLDIVLDDLDTPSLLAWRRTCRRNDEIIGPLLLQARDRILRHYVDDVEGFLGMLTWYRAVVMGEAALAFFLREHGALGDRLEVAVKENEGWGIEREIEEKFLGTSLGEPEHVDYTAVTNTVARRFFLPSGTTLVLYVTPSVSPLHPVALHMITAHINYFDADSFGSGYPALTLRRATFKREVESMTAREEIEMKADLDALKNRYGFTASDDVSTLVPAGTATATPQGVPSADILAGDALCLRAHYLCPGQERFFGDRGSLVDFFDLSPDTIERVRRDRRAPFGVATVWRLAGYEPCVSGCDGQNLSLGMNERTGYLCAVHEPFGFGCGFVGREWL